MHILHSIWVICFFTANSHLLGKTQFREKRASVWVLYLHYIFIKISLSPEMDHTFRLFYKNHITMLADELFLGNFKNEKFYLKEVRSHCWLTSGNYLRLKVVSNYCIPVEALKLLYNFLGAFSWHVAEDGKHEIFSHSDKNSSWKVLWFLVLNFKTVKVEKGH